MSAFESSAAKLRFFGDDLDPDEISMLLGCPATSSARMGEVSVGSKTGKQLTAKTGRWLLSAQDQKPANPDKQIQQLLAQVTHDLHIWRELTANYQADLYFGLFMSSSNDGASFSATTLHALSCRGLELCLDVYDPSQR